MLNIFPAVGGLLQRFFIQKSSRSGGDNSKSGESFQTKSNIVVLVLSEHILLSFQVLKHDQIASKLNRLSCFDPGLFLRRYEDGKGHKVVQSCFFLFHKKIELKTK